MRIGSEKWVEFPRVSEATDGVARVGWTGLPQGLDDDSLQLNLNAVGRGIIGWGGFESFAMGAYAGDEDRHAHGVATDSSGNALSTGVAVVDKAETSQRHVKSDAELNMDDVRNGCLDVRWNVSALSQRLEVADRYAPAVRAVQFDREIRKQAVRAVAWHNTLGKLLGALSEDALALGPMITILMDIAAMSFVPYLIVTIGVEATKDVVLPSFVIYETSAIFSMNIDARKNGKSFRDCLIDPITVSMRPTRAAIAIGTIASSRFVRPTPLKGFR
ncbi:hypothetical protein KC959_02350 [Candidatus Saccharibacteria bacterium]|nr:hypothetical protein [Candidatus Saccharibacteria bacterium]